MLIGLIVFFGLSFLILAHEAGHFFAAKRFGMRVDEFGFGFPPKIFGKKIGETEYSLNWLPIGGFVRIAGENDRIEGNVAAYNDLPENERSRYFMFQSAYRRAIVLGAGVFMNFIIGWLLVSAVFMIGTPRVLLVTGVMPDSPAAAAGITAGDVLEGFTASADFITFVGQHRGQETEIRIRRGGHELSLRATPRDRNEGALGVIFNEAGFERQGFFSALWAGLIQTGALFWYTLVSFFDLIRSIFVHATLPEGVAGPVGIFSTAQETGSLGLIYLVQLIALISVNLAALNLIPFPALDGGRLFFLLIEKAKGSPIGVRTEAWANGIGFALLLLLVFGITIQDIVRLFP